MRPFACQISLGRCCFVPPRQTRPTVVQRSLATFRKDVEAFNSSQLTRVFIRILYYYCLLCLVTEHTTRSSFQAAVDRFDILRRVFVVVGVDNLLLFVIAVLPVFRTGEVVNGELTRSYIAQRQTIMNQSEHRSTRSKPDNSSPDTYWPSYKTEYGHTQS